MWYRFTPLWAGRDNWNVAMNMLQMGTATVRTEYWGAPSSGAPKYGPPVLGPPALGPQYCGRRNVFTRGRERPRPNRLVPFPGGPLGWGSDRPPQGMKSYGGADVEISLKFHFWPESGQSDLRFGILAKSYAGVK